MGAGSRHECGFTNMWETRWAARALETAHLWPAATKSACADSPDRVPMRYRLASRSL